MLTVLKLFSCSDMIWEGMQRAKKVYLQNMSNWAMYIERSVSHFADHGNLAAWCHRTIPLLMVMQQLALWQNSSLLSFQITDCWGDWGDGKYLEGNNLASVVTCVSMMILSPRDVLRMRHVILNWHWIDVCGVQSACIMINEGSQTQCLHSVHCLEDPVCHQSAGMWLG